MTATTSPNIEQIQSLLAENGYEVSSSGPGSLRIQHVDSGVAIQAVLEGEILFFSLVCTVLPKAEVTADLMERMLDAGNGISTSSFQVYSAADGQSAITLNNFCKLQDMGAEDADDVLSCVQFLLVDVMTARGLLAGR